MDKAEEKIIKAAAFIRLVATQRESERNFTFISSSLNVCIITFRCKEKKKGSQKRGGRGKEGNKQM